LIRALASHGHSVTVATLWASQEERDAVDQLARAGARVLAEHQSPGRSLFNCLCALSTPDPLQAHYSWSPKLAARLAHTVRETSPDVVHVEHLRGVRYGLMLRDLFKHDASRPAVVWDSVDCISSLFSRAARESPARRVRMAARLELPRTRRYEAMVAGCFDRVLVTSEVDRHELLKLRDGKAKGRAPAPIDVLPNGVDLEYFSPVAQSREPMTLVVTGKMSYHANATAVVGFVKDVMPLIWSQLPDVRLWIVGKDPSPEVARLGDSPGTDGTIGGGSSGASRVVVTGTVEDIRPFLRTATMAVAPIQYGVGIQNKVLEALACGTPVVATPQAISALDARADEAVMVASSPGEFAATVVTLLRDPAARCRLGRAGRAFVERQHDWNDLAARLAGLYHDVRH
jgi:glycosyltransferase involved in cell wall biosynthesis